MGPTSCWDTHMNSNHNDGPQQPLSYIPKIIDNTMHTWAFPIQCEASVMDVKESSNSDFIPGRMKHCSVSSVHAIIVASLSPDIGTTKITPNAQNISLKLLIKIKGDSNSVTT